MITFAKGVTSGTVPMGGVIVRRPIHDAFMKGPDNAVELFHGYTYSAHPLACAAALATLDLYRDEGLFDRTLAHEALWAEAMHALRDAPHVVDIRTLGLTAAIELAPRSGAHRRPRLRRGGARLLRARRRASSGRRHHRADARRSSPVRMMSRSWRRSSGRRQVPWNRSRQSDMASDAFRLGRFKL